MYEQNQKLKIFFLFIIAAGLPVFCTGRIAKMMLFIVLIGAVLLILLNESAWRTLRILSFNKRKVNYASTFFILYFLWMILNLIVNGLNIRAVERMIQFFAVYFMFILGAQIAWKEVYFRLVRKIIDVMLLLFLCKWIMDGCPFFNYPVISDSANGSATVMLCWFAFLVITAKGTKVWHYLDSIIAFLFIAVTSSRASMLAGMVFIMVYGILSRIRKKSEKKFCLKVNLYFMILVFLILVFTFVYPTLMSSETGIKLQLISRKYFDKNFFSGRETIWNRVIHLIWQKPVIGYGAGIIPADLIREMDDQKSSHNLYLQTMLQNGIVGLSGLVMILKSILDISARKECLYKTGGMALIFSIMVHDTFEICLTQNFMAAGLGIWFMFGLGCNSKVRIGNI